MCSQHNLQPEPGFIEKCFQLHETILVRHGLMCVGAAFSGKSKVIDTLAHTRTHLRTQGFQGVGLYKLNPKAITSDQLYGKLDSDTKQWSDGVAAIIMRDCNRNELSDTRWIVFDGPVDAIWIENLNTVLDDNKKLCLTSGEIIKLSPEITVLFEVQDLAYASPATVSRCGMVFFES
jgi:dynein heavy chain